MKSEEATPESPHPSIGNGLLPTNEPQRDRGPQFLKLTPGQRLAAICLSPVWTGAITHYYARRMQLHTANDCPFCAHKSQPRFYAWIHIATEDLLKQFILQLPSSARPQLTHHYEVHGTLRGSHLYASRDGKHLNTPTTIEWRSPPEAHPLLPEPLDLTARLLTLMDPSIKHKDQTQPPNAEASKKE